MTTKKRWLKQIYSESQTNSQTNEISWSSSESDEELISLFKKKRNLHKTWLKWNEIKIENEFNPNCTDSSVRCNTPSTRTSLSDNSECSPIIGIDFQESSPILANFENTSTSPVLGKRAIVKKVRLRNTKRKIKETSPDVVQPKERIKSESPDIFSTQNSSIYISPSSPDVEANSTLNIEPFPSQNSTSVENNQTNSTNSSSGNSLQHELKRKKRKYKNDGLAFQLQRVVRLQNSRTSMWEHEMHTGKITEEDSGGVVEFTLNLLWKEYGNTLMECEYINKTCSNVEKTFLIVVGNNIRTSVIFKQDNKYKLYPPYTEKTILYKFRHVKIIYNATKFILCK